MMARVDKLRNAITSAPRLAESYFDVNQNGSRLAQTFRWLKSPCFQSPNSLLVQSVAQGTHNGNIVSDTISADHDCEDHRALDFCPLCFLGIFRVRCVSSYRRE